MNGLNYTVRILILAVIVVLILALFSCTKQIELSKPDTGIRLKNEQADSPPFYFESTGWRIDYVPVNTDTIKSGDQLIERGPYGFSTWSIEQADTTQHALKLKSGGWKDVLPKLTRN